MKFQAVLPSVYPIWTERCLNGMCTELRANLLIVDNTIDNIGVAAAWNLGIDRMEETDAEWLVILSASMRFGVPGGKDFLDACANSVDAVAIEAAHGIGWHMVAFPRTTIHTVGRFDTIFPAYYEDIDYGRRVSLALLREPPYWSKVSVDVSMAGFAHGIDLGKVKIDNAYLEARYRDKHGGPKGGETFFDHPYGNPDLDWTFIGDPPA
jgi:hypothetical protein